MRAKKPATYDDLLALPDNVLGQILAGEVVASPRPTLLHAQATSALLGDLRGPFSRGRGGPGGWLLLFEPELHLARDVVVPDVAGWRRTRLPALPPEPYLTLSPDWLCEVLSAGTRGIDSLRPRSSWDRAPPMHC